MKVIELLDRLEHADPNADVYIPCPHCCMKDPKDLLKSSEVHLLGSVIFLGKLDGECLEDRKEPKRRCPECNRKDSVKLIRHVDGNDADFGPNFKTGSICIWNDCDYEEGE